MYFSSFSFYLSHGTLGMMVGVSLLCCEWQIFEGSHSLVGQYTLLQSLRFRLSSCRWTCFRLLIVGQFARGLNNWKRDLHQLPRTSSLSVVVLSYSTYQNYLGFCLRVVYESWLITGKNLVEREVSQPLFCGKVFQCKLGESEWVDG